MLNIIFSKIFLAKLTLIIRNFWWIGVQDDHITRSLCLRAWADVCIEKKCCWSWYSKFAGNNPRHHPLDGVVIGERASKRASADSQGEIPP
jgi:hypothetical protein